MIRQIKCPPINENKRIRISELKDNLWDWICSKELQFLIKLFIEEEIETKEDDFSEYIKYLNTVVEKWDFRRKQANGGERWNIYDEEMTHQNADTIISCAEKLGMVNVVRTELDPDYIVPLGGARLTNLNRPQMVKYLMEQYNWKDKKIVALAANRLIDDTEREIIDTYAPGALTEYDAINAGLKITFGVSEFKDVVYDNENVNLQSRIRIYRDSYKGSVIYSVAAPSSNSNRRANSLDTFRFFAEKFSIDCGSKILLITSSIYVPYQLLKFIPLALKYDVEVAAIGTDVIGGISQKASNYLQEIKSAVNAIYDLKDIFELLKTN